LRLSDKTMRHRAYKVEHQPASLRPTMAAAMVRLAGAAPGDVVLDPMCGSGTILMEAAAIALGVPPGGKRAFAFEKLRTFDRKLWERARREASGGKRPVRIFGSDNNARALDAARKNLTAAGFGAAVKIERADILERNAPAGLGVMVANPPYGERTGADEELARFYPRLGHALKRKFAGWRCFFFTADLRLPKLIRLEPSARKPLWNGALECRLYEFDIVSGSHRR
jgi:putative N6-adenine-specific DNA methylase